MDPAINISKNIYQYAYTILLKKQQIPEQCNCCVENQISPRITTSRMVYLESGVYSAKWHRDVFIKNIQKLKKLRKQCKLPVPVAQTMQIDQFAS